jgi:predicted secreted protein
MPSTFQLAAWLLVGASVMACSGRAPSQPTPDPAAKPTPAANQAVTLTPQSYTFNVTRGQTFSVGLKSAGGGGYKWYLDEGFNKSVVRLKAQRVGELPADAALGKFADEIFDFEGVAPGEVTLTFAQYRPWEGPTRAVETRRYPVTVK